MTRAYSNDLRERVVAAVESGESCRAVAARYDVAVSSVVKWSQRYRATGSVAPGKMGGHRKRVLEPHRAFIVERISQTMAVGQRAADGQRLIRTRQRHAAAQQRAQALHELLRPLRQIGDGTLPDLTLRAVAFPQQDGRVRVAIGHKLNMHGISNHQYIALSSHKRHDYMATIVQIRPIAILSQRLTSPLTKSSGAGSIWRWRNRDLAGCPLGHQLIKRIQMRTAASLTRAR